MRTVNEVSKLTGISVRALHHYDAIGLLKPSSVTEAGYRIYDGAALKRLQNILFFRELQFPLKEIKSILDNPDFDPGEALAQQIKLLELQRKHIDALISFAREVQKGGIDIMNLDAFQKTEFDRYAEEVRERWGTTRAYAEYEQKRKERTEGEMKTAADRMMALFAELGSLRDHSPADREVQKKIEELQAWITENYYHCTDEILSGLGEMYAGDESMKHNIDQAGGEGTARFVSQAVAAYCSGRRGEKAE
ncbi:hypothetical protein C808_04953 [Lachnospiraceae bacterium M18-1]|nr:hypothetical protein C808_04953 [Lachnospiraceae bacterium M18-1]